MKEKTSKTNFSSLMPFGESGRICFPDESTNGIFL